MEYFRHVPENAPVDDEPYNEADEAAGIETEVDLREGRTVSIHEFAQKFMGGIMRVELSD